MTKGSDKNYLNQTDGDFELRFSETINSFRIKYNYNLVGDLEEWGTERGGG